MSSAGRRRAAALAVVASGCVIAAAGASAPPVGPLPAGPVSTLATKNGELVAVALPHRPAGRVWRLAGAVDPRVLRQVSEADVGQSVVIVYRATGIGSATLSFGLTRGERTKAYEARTYKVRVR